MTLSETQIKALRFIEGGSVFALNKQNRVDGNMRRTIESLLKLKMAGWGSGPIYYLVLTASGKEQLAKARWNKLPASIKAQWNGLCEAGKHGLDFKGQHCDLCADVLDVPWDSDGVASNTDAMVRAENGKKS